MSLTEVIGFSCNEFTGKVFLFPLKHKQGAVYPLMDLNFGFDKVSPIDQRAIIE
jgi:hypothetical protein